MNFNQSNIRFLILLLNLMVMITANASELTNGNFGATRPATTPRASSKPKKEKKESSSTYPYSGFVDTVDPSGKFIVLKGKSKSRQILVNSKTKIYQNDSASSLTEITPGARVTGAVRKNDSGQEEALSVRAGEKTAASRPKKMPIE